MKTILLSLSNDNILMHKLADHSQYELGKINLRQFPDEETYIQVQSTVQNKEVVIINSLERPNEKIVPLLLLAETAKDLGARRVGLCAPYLAYMRQDKRFQPGEGVTSHYFAKWLSESFDYLITVDPHLHRYHSLSELYSIPNTVIQSAPMISSWINDNINTPLLIGPDSESEQWVSEVAKMADAPYLILEKTRHGDRDVEISIPAIKQYYDHTPVIVDDIISSAQTMIETVRHLNHLRTKPPVCIGVHAIFAGQAYEALQKAGAGQVVTCNTITHPSNQIDLAALISMGIQQLGKII